jgi:site-specific recombinase XerD
MLGHDELSPLLDDWLLHLRGANKSTETIKSYGDGVRRFLAWCAETGRDPALDQRTVNAFTADLIEHGQEATTVRARQLSVRRFSAWLADPDVAEIDRDRLLGLKPVKLDSKVVRELNEDEIKALLKACRGKEFRNKRDTAIVRFMLETGARVGEVVAMELPDVDVHNGSAVIRVPAP